MTFGQQLRAARVAAGVGLRAASRASSLSATYWSLLERGKERPPTPETLDRVVDALGEPTATTYRDRLRASAAAERDGWRLDAGVSPEHDRLARLLIARWTALGPSEINHLESMLRGV